MKTTAFILSGLLFLSSDLGAAHPTVNDVALSDQVDKRHQNFGFDRRPRQFGNGRFGGGGFRGGQGGFGGNGGNKSGNGGNNGATGGNGANAGNGGNNGTAGAGTGAGGNNGTANAGGGGNNGTDTGNNGNGNNGNSGNGNNGNNGNGQNNNGNNGQNNNGTNGNNGQNNNNGNGAAATPVAANENGSAGPAVPKLVLNGGQTLDGKLLLTTQANANATAGQAASATSDNNFIDFCEGKTLTNGQQVTGGSCAVTPLGDIPSTSNMVSATFTQPQNFGTVKAGQTFTIGVAIQGMTLGSFTDAKKDYYAGPQQLDSSGRIVGHVHVTVQPMDSITSTKVLDPQTFSFFKGFDFGDVNGESTIDVQGGLTAGAYRMCTIMSNSNHASVIMPVAQRGAENTCSFFTVQ